MEVVDRRTWRPACAEEATWVGHVRLSPRGKHIAYARVEEDTAGIFVEDEDGAAHEVVSCEDDMLPEDIRWSPNGKWLAYQLAESDEAPGRRTIAWASAKGGQVQEVLGDVALWHPDGERVAIYASANKTLSLYDLDGKNVSLVGEAPDSGDPIFPPRMAIAPDGRRIALCTRSTFDDCLAVWIFEQGEAKTYDASFLTEIPGHQAYGAPFWSPKGVTVGLLISHLEQQKSGLVLFHGGKAKAHVVYDSDLVDPPMCPAWSPNGKLIAFMRTVEEPRDPDGFPAQLVVLNVNKRVLTAIAGPGEVFGEPRFSDKKRIVVDGDDAAYVLGLDKSK